MERDVLFNSVKLLANLVDQFILLISMLFSHKVVVPTGPLMPSMLFLLVHRGQNQSGIHKSKGHCKHQNKIINVIVKDEKKGRCGHIRCHYYVLKVFKF